MRQIKKDSINISVDIYIIDSTDGTPELGVLFNTAGMDLEYRREGAVAVNVTEVTLAALTTAHTDGGFLEIGHGLYRFDLPDASVATGASSVSIQGTVTGMIILPQTIQLVDFDPEDSTRLGLTSLPNAAADSAGGLPISDSGGLALDTKLANTNEITVARMAVLTDWINGGRLDLLLDAIPTTAMRGTDGANTTIPDAAGVSPTAIEIRQEIDTNSTKSGYALSATGADLILKTSTFALAIADSIWDELLAGHITADSAGLVLNELQNGGRIDLLIDAIKNVTDLLPDAGALTTISTDTARLTSTRAAVLTDWINGGRLDLLLDAIKAITDLLTLAAINAEVDTALNTAIPDSPTANSLNDILDRQEELSVAGTASGIPTTTTMVSDITITDDAQFNGRIITFRKDTTTTALQGQQTDVTGSTASTNTLTFTALTTAPASGDVFELT